MCDRGQVCLPNPTDLGAGSPWAASTPRVLAVWLVPALGVGPGHRTQVQGSSRPSPHGCGMSRPVCGATGDPGGAPSAGSAYELLAAEPKTQP